MGYDALATEDCDGLEERRTLTLCYATDGKDDDGWINKASNTLNTVATIERQSTGRCLIHDGGAPFLSLGYVQGDNHNFGINDIGLQDQNREVFCMEKE
eukprot:g55809.t1